MPTGASIAINSLKREGVNVVFGIPGGAMIIFYDELRDSGIRHVLMRHEQGAAHAADGYARASGKPGVCIATSGPGATNLVTGIATAYLDSSPIIALTGQVPTKVIGSDAFQETDIVGIVNPIVKYSFQLKTASEIPIVFKKAFYIATHGRPGPVLIDFPKDVQQEEIKEVSFPDEVYISGRCVYVPEPDPFLVKKAAEMIIRSEKPLMLCGGGVIHSNASEEVMLFVENLKIPVVTTLMGKGVIPEDHPLCLGMIGMHGRMEANEAVSEADLIIAVGTRFSDRSTGVPSEFAKQAKIIHIDIDESEIDKNIKVDLPILSDAKKALRMLYGAIIRLSRKYEKLRWIDRIRKLKQRYKQCYEEGGGGLKPWRILKILREKLPKNSIITTGVGQNQMWVALHFKVLKPRTLITSGGLGTMGFGFPAAIGAKVACPDKHVVCIDGDGSFLMTCQNLGTVMAQNIPVIVIIFNNRAFGMVRQWQDLFFKRRFIAVDLGQTPDFVKLAEAFGAKGFRVGSYDEFEEAIKKALSLDVCTIIDVPIHPDEKVFPIVPPGKPLKEAIMG